MNLPSEELWLPILSHQRYEISSFGRVYSHKTNRLLTTTTGNRGGHKVVDLDNRTYYVHTLVLEAFKGPCPTIGMECCHNDGNGHNNNLGNLRWGTRSSNNKDRVRHGTHNNANKVVCPRGHKLELPNLNASFLKRGQRSCLSCNRATATVSHARHRKGIELDFRSIANTNYAKIMHKSGQDGH